MTTTSKTSTAVKKKAATKKNASNIAEWFDERVNFLRQHQQEIELDVANGGTRRLFESMMKGDLEEISLHNIQMGQRHFISQMLTQYLILVSDLPFRKLAFGANYSALLIWAEINDGDEATENALTRAGSKILGQYGDYGFEVLDMIVEASENLKIPTNYIPYKKS
jgi:hypothetical protein